MGICEKIGRKDMPKSTRPSIPPTKFGNTPKSMTPQAVYHVDQRGVLSEKRNNMTLCSEKKKDEILSWGTLVDYCKTLSLAVVVNDEELRWLLVLR